MEIWSLLLLSSFIIILLIKVCKKLPNKTTPEKYQKLPPSPPKLPIIGHLHHLMGRGMLHEALRLVSRKHGPIVHLQIGQASLVVISSPQAAKEAMVIQDPACADRPKSLCTQIIWYDHMDIIFGTYGEHWRQMRKILVMEFLSTKNVKSFGSIRQVEVTRLLESLSDRGHRVVDLRDAILGYTSAVVCRAAFGRMIKGDGSLERTLNEAMGMTGAFELADLFPSVEWLRRVSWNRRRLLNMRGRLDAVLDGFVEEHKLKLGGEFGGEDIVDVLLRMQKSDDLKIPITDDNIKAIIFDIFSAGVETTSSTLDMAMAEMMRNPDVMAKLQSEIREAFKGKKKVEERDVELLKYLKCVIKETLRLHPPATIIPRSCRDECKIGGYSIPIGSKVLLNIWSIGRDPEYWPEPESFKPERFENNSCFDFLGDNFEFIPFGAGRRICPGMNFGYSNIELPLAQLLYHFDWEMPKGMTPDDIDMTEREGLAVSRKNGLFLVPIPYGPSFQN
ncbi:hypothetical protein CASFOL_006560 [Castilleja foliolosa]|uniref:Cytochrome P450 n=1 Tax=Castilleja foliolosa TaxID=1961234 RepID=A0ABD3E7A8_9LAMI